MLVHVHVHVYTIALAKNVSTTESHAHADVPTVRHYMTHLRVDHRRNTYIASCEASWPHMTFTYVLLPRQLTATCLTARRTRVSAHLDRSTSWTACVDAAFCPAAWCLIRVETEAEPFQRWANSPALFRWRTTQLCTTTALKMIRNIQGQCTWTAYMNSVRVRTGPGQGLTGATFSYRICTYFTSGFYWLEQWLPGRTDKCLTIKSL